MPALPTDIALYTNDGIVVTSPTNPATSAAIRAADPNARDMGEAVLDTFFDDPADAQAMLDEKFAVLSIIAPVHEAVQLRDNIGLGRDIALTPAVPQFRIVDEERRIDQVCRLRAYAYAMDTDRFSIEVLG